MEELRQAVAVYAARAAVKLRRQASVTAQLLVFVQEARTGPEPAPLASARCARPAPTDDRRRLIAAAVHGVESLVAPGRRYAKAGVLLLDVTPRAARQGDLFAEVDSERDRRLLATLDPINATLGAGALRLAREGFEPPWAMRQTRRTPAYTTDWRQLPWAR